MGKVCIIEVSYQSFGRRGVDVNYIQTVKIDSIEPGNKWSEKVFSFPSLADRRKTSTHDDESETYFTPSINDIVEETSLQIRNYLQDCEEVILFNEKDKFYIKSYINSSTDIRHLK